jgi:hypothetical protein
MVTCHKVIASRLESTVGSQYSNTFLEGAGELVTARAPGWAGAGQRVFRKLAVAKSTNCQLEYPLTPAPLVPLYKAA